MPAWPNIPEDAINWLRGVFAEANRQVSQRLLNVPNLRETSLDDGLIEALIPFTPPRLLPSGTVIEMHIHNIGGLRRISRWETADIAVLVQVYGSGRLFGQKMGLLQSKRLYPENLDVGDDDPVGFMYGLNKFLHPEPATPAAVIHRQFEFTSKSLYAALKDDEQITEILRMNARFGEVVHYLFYNPPVVPVSIRYPVIGTQYISEPPLGCRVYRASDVSSALAPLDAGKSPSLEALERSGAASNWRFEDWIELLLRCKVGQLIRPENQGLVTSLIERRSGPIAAAISVSVTLPDA